MIATNTKSINQLSIGAGSMGSSSNGGSSGIAIKELVYKSIDKRDKM